ncbi:hypothetical protein K1719_011163 [Acacia pycnantha]|nr:hypothetical protein K1719_011163 [Acacia pycnantha]
MDSGVNSGGVFWRLRGSSEVEEVEIWFIGDFVRGRCVVEPVWLLRKPWKEGEREGTREGMLEKLSDLQSKSESQLKFVTDLVTDR